MNYSYETLHTILLSKNHKWFYGENSLNIVAIRNSSTSKITNLFDDLITCSWLDENGELCYKEWSCTTDPGLSVSLSPDNPKGIARIVPGQYLGAWQIGKHKGKYTALVQCKPISVYRDNNRNNVFDTKKIEIGIFGINIHKAGVKSQYVQNWSEGCVVFQKSKDFDEFMKLVQKSVKLYGDKFTMTLI